MSKAINRRAIMAGAAATLPAIATLPAVAGQSGPDAELITLSAQLGPLVREQEIQNQLDLKRSDQYEAAVARSTGISSDKAPDRENDPTGYWAIRGQLFTDVKGRECDQRLSVVPSEDGEAWKRSSPGNDDRPQGGLRFPISVMLRVYCLQQ